MSEECIGIALKLNVCVEMLDLFNRQRESGELCDVAIIADGRKLNAHRLVLSSRSPFFRTMFSSSMKEAKTAEVNFPEIDYDIMEKVIQFIYTTKLNISIETAQHLLIVANFLQMEDLVDLCGNYIGKNIDVTNCFSVRELMKRTNCEEKIISRANDYINVSITFENFLTTLQSNFLQIVQNEPFLELSLDDVMELLNNEVCCTSEEDVFHAAVRWLEARDEPKEYSEQVLRCIRMPLLSTSFKQFHITKNSLFKKKKQLNVSKVSRPLKTSLLVLRLSDDVSSFHTHDPSTKKWTHILDLKEKNYTDLAANKDYIFTCREDIELKIKIFEVNNRITKEWTRLSPTMSDRGSTETVAVGNKFYVFKHSYGRDSVTQTTVFNMDSKNKRGKKLKNVGFDISDASIFVIDKYIYVIKKYRGITQKLDTVTDTWFDLGSDMFKGSFEPYTTYKGKICGLPCGEDAINVYDGNNNEWKELTQLPEQKEVTGFLSTTDGIYAFNNSCDRTWDSETDPKHTFDFYDVARNIWCEEEFPSGFDDLLMVTIPDL